MCLLTDTFKLCSCNAAQLSPDEIGWILTRVNPHKKINRIMGKPAFPTISKNTLDIRTHIIVQLNQRNCFDFDYTPNTNDRLSIRTQTDTMTWVHFRYQSPQWKVDESTKFSAWRQKSESYKKGPIQCVD
jgi:hypothetical protein